MSPAQRLASALFAAVLVGALLPATPQLVLPGEPATVSSRQVELRLEGTQVVELPILASHVTLSWPDDHGADEDVEDEDIASTGIRVAFSLDGSTYGDEHEVVHDDAGVLEQGVAHGGVMWTGGARFARISTAGVIGRLKVVAIDSPPDAAPQHSPWTVSAAVDHPQVISRAGWEANDSYRYREVEGEMVVKWPPSFFPVQRLIVHHTAGVNNDPDPARTIRAIYFNQAMNRLDSDGTSGWGDIGYNFLIDESGRIYEGRYSRDYGPSEIPAGDNGNGQGVAGAHVANYNSGTLGIALLGHLVGQDATPAARAALEWLLAWAAERYSIDPLGGGLYTNPVSGTQKANPNISGHRDWAATACPGGVFYATLPALRQAVADRIDNGGAPTIPPWSPKPPPPPPGSPSVPQGLTASAQDNFVISLSWQPSTASVSGPVQYRVFRDGTAIGTKQSATTFTDQRTKANTFSYQVRAIDAAGNKSALSAPVTISSTKNAGGTPPPSGVTVPQGLSASAHDNFVISLSWQPSSSSVAGTIRYRVFRNGTAIGTKQSATTFNDQRTKANTFSYQVRAIDAAGNKSALSPPVTISSRR